MYFGYPSQVRTTLDLAKPVLDELRALQKKEGRTLGELASQILAEGLRGRNFGRVCETPRRFRWRSQSMEAKVNLHDKEAVSRAMGDS